MIENTLSQTQGAIPKGYKVNSPYDTFPVLQIVTDVAEAADDYVLASTTLVSGTETIVSGASLTSPDNYRALRVKGNQASVYGSVYVEGKDRGGRVVTDTIIASGVTSIDGLVPMSEVLKVTLPAYAATGDEISVGISEKLGFSRAIENVADLVLTEKKASAVSSFNVIANGTVDAAYNTVIPSGGITVNDSFKFGYGTKLF